MKYDTHLLPGYVDSIHSCCYNADEKQLLINIHTLSHKMLAHSPHLVSAKVLVLERKLDIIGTPLIFLNLNGHCKGTSWGHVSHIFTFVNTTSPLFLRPSFSAIGLGIDIWPH